MSSFNPNLTYFVERLQGVSTNTFRLESQNKLTAAANDIITFDLPSNAILNLRSFKVWCNATTQLGSATAGARLPPVADLIERVEVSVGGIVLAQGTNFVNVLREAKKSLQVDYCDSVTGHPEYVRNVSYVDTLGSVIPPAAATVITGTLNEGYQPTTNEPYFCIDEWEGFLGTADPKLLDTSLMPDIRVRLYMASNNVLTSSQSADIGNAAATAAPTPAGFCGNNVVNAIANAGSGGGAYQLTGIHATIEAIGLADQSYDKMLSAQMSAQGFLEIPYKSYQSFNDTHTGSSRFSVSTQSLDRVWLAWRNVDYNAQYAPVAIGGHKLQGGFTSPTAGAATLLDQGVPQYDVGGVLETNSEKYKSVYFNFNEPLPGMKLQLQLNGAYMPQFSAYVEELYGMSRNSLPDSYNATKMTLDQYKKNYCVQCFRLNMPDSEYSRLISGLDTRAVNLQGIVRTEGGAINANLMIFTESTETMRVGPGRSIEIIS